MRGAHFVDAMATNVQAGLGRGRENPNALVVLDGLGAVQRNNVQQGRPAIVRCWNFLLHGIRTDVQAFAIALAEDAEKMTRKNGSLVGAVNTADIEARGPALVSKMLLLLHRIGAQVKAHAPIRTHNLTMVSRVMG